MIEKAALWDEFVGVNVLDRMAPRQEANRDLIQVNIDANIGSTLANNSDQSHVNSTM